MSVKVTRRGNYVKAIAKYEGLPVLRIGVPRRNSPRDDDTTNAMLLGYHQFGGPNLPARKPLSVLETDPGFKDALRLAVKLAEPAAMRLAGEVGVNAVRGAIEAGLSPAVKADTVKSRRINTSDSTPLIDTRQLINSIGYEVK